MNFAIVIPARKGSKSIKNKNLKLLLGVPLIEHTFKSIKNIKLPKFILSNDLKIKKLAKKYKIITDYNRPKNVSKDNSSLLETLLDFLSWLKNQKLYKVDVIIILQATSPLRKTSDIINAIKQYKRKNLLSLFSVSESQEHPYETINLFRNGNWKYNLPKYKKFYRRQDFDINSYFINGAIYMIDKNTLIEKKILISKKHGIFKMKKINSIDIDDEEDLLIASKIIK